MANSKQRNFFRGRQEESSKALFASAVEIKLNSEAETLKKLITRSKEWQKLAWKYRREIGEIWYATSFIGNAMSKVRLIAAERPTIKDEPPTPTEDPLALQALARIEGKAGGYAKIMRAMGIAFTVPGECYLVGLTPQTLKKMDISSDEECWEIRSISEIERKDDKVILRGCSTYSCDTKVELSANDFLGRMWVEDPEYSFNPDSPMRGILPSCEELQIVERAFRAHGRSRIPNAKILILPKEWSEINEPTQDESAQEDGDEEKDPLDEALMESFTTPVEDESSAASLAPFIIRYPIDQAKNIDDLVKVLDLSAHADERLEGQMQRVLRRIAQGLPLPNEYIFGLGSANHWGAGQIEDSAFREHLEPLCLISCEALTYIYFYQELVRLKHPNPDKFIVWYDPTDLIVRPERHKNANFGVQEGVLSGAAWRKLNGFTEKDAPTTAEIAQRVQQRRGSSDESPPRSTPAGDGTEPEAPGQDNAVGRSDGFGSGIGHRLAELDQSLMQRMHVAVNLAINRGLERAEGRIISRAQKDPTIKSAAKGAPRGRVAMTLGPSVVKSLGLDNRALVMGEFDQISAHFRREARKVWGAALYLIGSDTLAAEGYSQADKWVEEAALWLEGTLESHAQELLYKTSLQTVDWGERDEAKVPYRLAREAVARAGGNEPDGDRWLTRGIATSPTILKAVQATNMKVTGKWVWHSPLQFHMYTPHLRLHNKIFSSWHDLRLREGGQILYPGDHEGCQCLAIPVIVGE